MQILCKDYKSTIVTVGGIRVNWKLTFELIHLYQSSSHVFEAAKNQLRMVSKVHAKYVLITSSPIRNVFSRSRRSLQILLCLKFYPYIPVFHDKQIWQKIWQKICQIKNYGKINLLKSCFQWDLISQHQPLLLWSLTPNQLGHPDMCWMGDLSNELQSHSIDSWN